MSNIEEKSARERVLTAKGKEHKVSQVKEKVGSFKRKWKNLVNKIGKGMKESFNLMHACMGRR